MTFSTKQIAPGKWGIYNDAQLLATVSSEAICKTVLANLSSGRRDLPTRDENALYKISAEIKPPLAKLASSEPPAISSDDYQSIEATLDLLNEQQLEEALIKAQQGSIPKVRTTSANKSSKLAYTQLLDNQQQGVSKIKGAGLPRKRKQGTAADRQEKQSTASHRP